ncbi:hypothetical protein NPIL_414391, partial [Nephila pilipes]
MVGRQEHSSLVDRFGLDLRFPVTPALM